MLKSIFILAFTICAIFAFGQETTFEANVNYDARILKQALSENRDSLILKSRRTIRQVDIFNTDYMKSIVVNANESKIDLSNLPLGEFVVQARIGGRRIIMYIVKSDSVHQNPETLELKLNETTSITSIQNSDITTDTISPKKLNNNRSAFWVVREVNTKFGSSKTMSLENEAQVSKMILKNRIELNTQIAKYNKLIVYEVYNTKKFMFKQLKRRKYYKSSQSNFFNVVPYYSSESTNEDGIENYNNVPLNNSNLSTGLK